MIWCYQNGPKDTVSFDIFNLRILYGGKGEEKKENEANKFQMQWIS